jgi:S-formylglutathione hydrolase FrmB
MSTIVSAGMATVGAIPGPGHRHVLSLLRGWLPVSVQATAVVVLVAAVGPRRGGWLRRWVVPVLGSGGLAAFLVHRYVYNAGLADDPAPRGLWVWIGLTASALMLAVAGWRGVDWPWPGGRWPRRALSLLAVPLSLLCVGLMLNTWVGYFPTATEAWAQLSAGPLPDQTPSSQLPRMAGTGAGMHTGALVPVTIPAISSHFPHRTEYVYLPPAWFTRARPKLPVVLMLGGEFNTPADWIRVGDAVSSVDGYAAAHHGETPILAFVDIGGAFNNDTECVDGPRGNVATYLTRDVPPFLQTTFHTAVDAGQWGLVGWSAGGTCAVDLAVMHPELFSDFIDIAGDLGPNTGDKNHTIETLYGGDSSAWKRYDPLTVLSTHIPYTDTAGWFVTSVGDPGGHGRFEDRPGLVRRRDWSGHAGARGFGGRAGPAGYGGRPDGGDDPQVESSAARQPCTAASAKNVQCTMHTLSGGHSWQVASAAFRLSLPWLSNRLGLPESTPPPTTTAR